MVVVFYYILLTLSKVLSSKKLLKLSKVSVFLLVFSVLFNYDYYDVLLISLFFSVFVMHEAELLNVQTRSRNRNIFWKILGKYKNFTYKIWYQMTQTYVTYKISKRKLFCMDVKLGR